MRILTLDVAPTTLGWGFAEDQRGPQYGVYRPPSCGENYLPPARAVRQWLDLQIGDLRPDLVAIEQPIHVPTNSLRILRPYYGFAHIIMLVCHDRKVAYQEYGIDETRQQFLGADFKKRFRGRDAIKEAVKAECAARGWTPQDDNAGDALAVLDRARAEHIPGYPVHPSLRVRLRKAVA